MPSKAFVLVWLLVKKQFANKARCSVFRMAKRLTKQVIHSVQNIFDISIQYDRMSKETLLIHL